ncbi:MAG: hypothetical protein NTX50_14450 [Candidatus Sumerlaeota bacterium]|nr:hypothetical protein [Candidatus Sumerlaeota bacterium]
MQRCPRCEMLLLDTDTECPRCNAQVSQLLTPEQASEKKKQDLVSYRTDMARKGASAGDYIPPTLPPFAVPIAGILFAFSALWRAIFSSSASDLSLWKLFISLSLFTMTAICINGGILYGGVTIVEGKKPGIERALFTASLCFGLQVIFMVILSWIGEWGGFTKYGIVWVIVNFIAIKCMFELVYLQTLGLVAVCTATEYLAVMMAYRVIGEDALKTLLITPIV